MEARNCYKSNASKDIEMLQNSSFNVMSSEETLVSDKKRDQKSLVQDNDGNSSSRKANHSIVPVCLHSDKDNGGASCGTSTINNDGVTFSGNQGLGYDVEERQLEYTKHSRLLEASHHELISSSSDKYHDEDEEVIKSNKRDQSDETHASPASTPPESDVEEEDVKVCDICGDAGREDLLAVCSRCSDGAEHTYCMREMLDKVPEGDWLCEECVCNELSETRNMEHSKKLGSHERSKSLARTSSLLSDLSLKLDSKDPFCEQPKLRSVSLNRQTSSKRSGEKMESCPTASKQTLLSSMGSPTTSSPRQMAVVSKDIPFKILDKIKGKPNSQISTGNEFTGDSSESARSPTTNSHVLKGNFLKSNSFSSSNSKQNAKVTEDVLQKQGVDAKEGVGKLFGKSISFKGLGRSSAIEPKVKMLPAKCAPVQDLKSQKHGRDHTSYERKNTIKLDHSLPGQLPANPTKRSSLGSDGISSLSVTSTCDYKSAQTDGKLSNMLKLASHKSSDIMTNLGEVKKLSSTGGTGSTSVYGTSNALVTKRNHFSVKDGSVTSSSQTAKGSLNADGPIADGQDSQSKKAPEKFSGCSRQGLNSGMVSGSRRKLPLDASALKTKDGPHEENKLKAAIEAAMQKKQDMFKKNKFPEKPSEFRFSNTQVYHGGDAVSSQVRDSMSEEAMHEGDLDLHDINLNSFKPMPVSGAKQINLHRADLENSPVGESVLTVSAIPEQESVWRGGFEIHRIGKLPDMCCGFQAHMSTFASGKVLEMVGKLPKKIIFKEVPRPCAWPVQFKELGARDDNIALYFFATDSESYMRSYKILVDYMMKHDLALRGNINGVELLVFPSNHLPHKSKCWNTSHFIWGVFRGMRLRFLDDRFCSLGKCEFSVSDTVVLDKDVTSTEKPCLYQLPAEQSSVSGNGHSFVPGCEVPIIAGSSPHQSASLLNGSYNEECSVGGTYLNLPIGAGNHNKRPKNHYTSLCEECPESESAALREEFQQNPDRIVDHQKSTEAVSRSKVLPSEVMLDKRDSSLPSQLPLVGKHDGDAIISSINLQVLDTVSDYINKVKSENSVKQEKRCLDNMQKSGQMKLGNDIDEKEDINYLLEDGVKLNSEGDLRLEEYGNDSADCNVNDLCRLQYSTKRHLHEDSVAVISLAAALTTCKKRPWEDRIDTLEDEDQASLGKSMYGFDNFSECKLYGRPPFGDRMDAQMSGVSSSSHKEDNEADNEKSTATNPGSAEECFFLADSHSAQGIQPGGGSLPLEVALSENEDRLPGESPNLELALGVKKKQAREGVLCFFAGSVDRKDPDRPPDIVASSKEEDGDASASLSLSLGFPFQDKERTTRPKSPTVEQTVSARHEINTSLLLFRGSSSK